MMIDVRTIQISSLEKIRKSEDIKNEVNEVKLFLGEHYSYQIVLEAEGSIVTEIEILSPLAEYITVYSVEDCVMDFPQYPDRTDERYLTDEPGLMPDLLIPVANQEGKQMFIGGRKTFWIEICVPVDFIAGKYDVTVKFSSKPSMSKETPTVIKSVLHTEIIGEALPRQELLFTQWFHVDCIATVHNVEIYSEAHWTLIDRYMKTAAELGINMILTPVITPPLDTEIGAQRPNTQLVKITKTGEEYSFDFSLLHRWIEMCLKNGIEHFEISHLFSQWGADFAPNIYVTENGEEKHMFGWHVSSGDECYKNFLRQFLPKLTRFLETEGIAQKCYFHISDEPEEKHLEKYRNTYEFVKPLLGECRLMDALSHYVFYEKGLVETPVCTIDNIEPFIENRVNNLWAYYCCAQCVNVGNRFMAMPSYRNRILGVQLYKYGIKGFLQWGYNFYYSQYSRYAINPYITSSAGGAFPSGDAFSVYPGKDGPLKSLRALVFYEALQDILVCRMLERRIGREAVIKMIDDEARMNVSFSRYPDKSTFVPNLIDKMKRILTA